MVLLGRLVSSASEVAEAALAMVLVLHPCTLKGIHCGRTHVGSFWVRQTRRIARHALLAHLAFPIQFLWPDATGRYRSSFTINYRALFPDEQLGAERSIRMDGSPRQKDEHVAASFRQTALFASLCHFAMWYLRCGLKQRSPRLKLHCERTS